ncbi:DUF4430 domain-containing protein [Ruminococcus sp.]|uniref:DUF4430 domain-containing protein n=1 Tax=Ruminococcus sp. TaxID=41978 RepID=UPI00386D8C57
MVKNKLFAILLCVITLLCGVLSAVPVSAQTYTVAQVQSLCDGIVAYNGYHSAQDFIDGTLTDNAGTMSEFYILALSQSGDHDFSRYENALLSYLDDHSVASATSREKYALALAAVGSTDRYITDTADEAIGGMGMMSLVFGLHLLNNGYTSRLYSTDGLLSEILSREMDEGGWAVMGSWGDVDVTAMTLQALAPHYGGRGDVTDAIDRAITWLSERQLDSGGFKTMGTENCESAAQVVMALSALGIDPQVDGRFIKNGTSVMEAMLDYRLSNGGFSHTGSDGNATATVEVFCALTAYRRMRYGQSGFYLLDHVNHSSPSDKGAGGSGHSGGSQSGGDSGSRGNAPSNRSDSGSGGADNSGDSHVEYDSSGNRIITINGQRFIESTNAAGEKVTVNVSETEGRPRETRVFSDEHGDFQSGATEDTALHAASADESGSGGYKPYAILGVVAVAGGVCAVLYLLKKRNKKHYIAVAVIAAAGILFILLTNFESAEEHYQPQEAEGDFTATLSIRCDTIKDLEKKNNMVPDNCIILDTTEFTASSGDTVYDVLQNAVRSYRILIDNRGSDGAAYIAGIDGLYEFDYGDLSGWMYRVNGDFPDVGCQSYTVREGDKIEWLYTTNIGKDLV